MKTNVLNFRLVVKTFVLALSTAFILTSCSDDEETAIPQNPMAVSTEVTNIPLFVENARGEMPGDPAELLYENRKSQPIIAPDGHQVTWGEFAAVRGKIEVECTEDGTRAKLDVTGLIPNGVYTIWNVTVRKPGFDPTNAAEMFNISGIGAAGDGFGKDNIVVASERGTAQIETLSPGGALSMFGNIAPCSLTDEYEWHVVGAYHIDGKTYGPDLGPDGTVTEQFGFIFVPGKE